RSGQGRENAKIYMAIHPEMMAEVSALVRAANGIGEEVAVPEDEKGQEELPLVEEYKL
ncbi:DNA recombination/repair protein RecA, partial [Enterococcus faecium]